MNLYLRKDGRCELKPKTGRVLMEKDRFCMFLHAPRSNILSVCR